MNFRKAVFIDRDGTINEEVNYLSSPDDLRVFPAAREALSKLRKCGFLNIIVTNQSGISRGYLTEDDLALIHRRLSEQLESEGKALIDGIYYSPFHPEGTIKRYKIESNDRKPGTGMIERAASEHNIDLKESFFIGDSLTDMQCAFNAGLRKILVMTGYGNRDLDKCTSMKLEPDFIAKDILDAADFIEAESMPQERKTV